MQIKYKILLIVGIIIISTGVGFIIGKKSVKITEKIVTEYITLDPIHDSISIPEPVYINKPIDTINLLNYCIDNGLYSYLIPKIIEEKYIYEKVDTTAIIQEFITEKLYDITLFDIDTIGKAIVHPKVQYNQLTAMSYEFYPIMKTTTITKTIKSIEPFISAGISLDNSISAGAGVFFKSGIGIQGIYRRNLSSQLQTGELNILYKF